MIEFCKAEEWPLGEYPEISASGQYKLSKYTVITEYDEGYLLFHTITWSMFYLSKEEYENILNIERFKKLHIVLDELVDENPIAEAVYIKRTQAPEMPTYDNVHSFVIFTTTYCNARCFYCYENGLKPIYMNLKTAENVCSFIKKRVKDGEEVTISWFGGEPLLNTNIIDYIVDNLKESGRIVRGNLITNGYLLNDKILSKAINDWNLAYIQITIDGTEKIYNETKNYRNKDTNPFQVVMNNIESILNDGRIPVYIRLNVSDKNIDDIRDLIMILEKRFEKWMGDNLSIYVAVLFQISCSAYEDYPEGFEEEMKKLYKDFPELFNEEENRLMKRQKDGHCMGDGGGLSIYPNGKLSPCEHWDNTNVLGDVVSGITNFDIVKEWWSKGGETSKKCFEYGCPLIPTCRHYLKCDATVPCQTEITFLEKNKRMKKRVAATFEYYLKKRHEERESKKSGE